MKHTVLISILFVGVLAFVGCATATKNARTVNLVGEWDILTANGVNTEEGMSPAFIAFDSVGNVHGNASVNSFFGSYTLAGDSLRFSPLGMTRMMGPNIEIEDAVISAINNIATIKTDTTVAMLYDKQGQMIMLWQKR